MSDSCTVVELTEMLKIGNPKYVTAMLGSARYEIRGICDGVLHLEEIVIPPSPEKPPCHCGRPRSAWPSIFLGGDTCSVVCAKAKP